MYTFAQSSMQTYQNQIRLLTYIEHVLIYIYIYRLFFQRLDPTEV